MSTYRTIEVQSKTISPEDEMRLILAKSNEPGLKRAIFGRVGLLLLVASEAAMGRTGWQFWAICDVALLAYFVWVLTKRARLRKRLAAEGYNVTSV